MNKLITILILSAMMLPISTLSQPNDEYGPRERPDRDRAQHRDRTDRTGEDRLRPSDHEPEHADRPNKHEPIRVDQIDEAIATLRAMHGDAQPRWLARIEQQAKEDPEAAAKSLSRFPRIREMMHAKANKPEVFALHTSQSQLMRQLMPKIRKIRQAHKKGDQDKVDQLRPKIRETIEQLFAVRMQLKELEIKQIREKLKRAEDELASIRDQGDALIDEKMNDIMTGSGPPNNGIRPERSERDRSRP